MKIGILGGTFNPPHLGHRMLCENFQKLLGFDKLLIIPTFIPPHKESDCLTIFENRLEMCRLAFGDIDNVEFCTIENERKGKSYTYNTLTQLKEKYVDSEFFFLMGSDMFKTFKEWYRWEDILSICKICTCERFNDESNEKLYPEFADRIIYCDFPAFEVSSSQIRQKLKNKEDVSSFLCKDVYDFILKEGFYS